MKKKINVALSITIILISLIFIKFYFDKEKERAIEKTTCSGFQTDVYGEEQECN